MTQTSGVLAISFDDKDTDRQKVARRRQPSETRAAATRALVVVPVLKTARRGASTRATFTAHTTLIDSVHSPENRLAEAVGLAQAIDLDIVGQELVSLAALRPATLFGSGKVEEFRQLIAELEAGLVIVDQSISPGQQRNLEKAWGAKVIDRTGLILEIFGARAKTREGVLQVELAHLTYQKGRLVRAWTHLERQRGGGGFLGGPGEAQIELDRRILQTRIDAIKRELAEVVKTRELHREGRRKVPYPVVAIVGYTNAGKSTLFNIITGAGVLAKDQVFATLDPTMREVRLPSGRRIILSDTVGFISDLPTMLVAAFRATLEEVIEADIILHVRDIAHAETEAQAHDVRKVLGDLGVDTAPGRNHIIEVWNKIDLLSKDALDTALISARYENEPPALVSAVTGAGIDNLLQLIDDRLGCGDEVIELTIPSDKGRLLNWLHENTEVLSRASDGNGNIEAKIRVTNEKKGRVIGHLRKAGIPV